MINGKPPRGSGLFPDHIMISINSDARYNMTVTWRTDKSVETGFALSRKDGETESKRTDSDNSFFKSDIDESYIHWAHIKNLEPGTKYYYTCGDETHRSDEFYFTTEPENCEKFKFLAISDQQKGEPHDAPDYSIFNSFMLDVLKKNPDIAFILSAGDNTDCGQHEVQWNGMFATGAKGFAEYKPYMMAEGNHDTRGFKDYDKGIGRYYSEPAEFFCNQLRGSYNYDGPDSCKTENYTFDYGNVHFNVFGVNFPEDVNEWLKKDIPSSDKTWKVGVYHFPIAYSGSDCQNNDGFPIMKDGTELEDIIFSGHEHSFARSFPYRDYQLFDRPSEGTVNYVLGDTGDNPPGTLSLEKVWHCSWYPNEEKGKLMACLVEVDRKKMTLTSFLSDGTIVDKCVIDKEKDEIIPNRAAPIFNKNKTRYMYKGADIGLASMDVYAEKKDNVWYLPFAVLAQTIGGKVIKEKGKVTVDVNNHVGVFTENSASALADGKEKELEGKVYRGSKGQLYIPASACSIFGMTYTYAERNNFLSFEHPDEIKPITVQP